MTIHISSESHLDHGLSWNVVAFLLEHLADRTEFFIATVELPEDLGTVPCGLVGPAVGGAPVPETDVEYRVRPGRRCASRMLRSPCAAPQVRVVTVIAGPAIPGTDGPCVLYTAHGGPCAPRETGDTSIDSWDALLESRAFWAEHALVPGTP